MVIIHLIVMGARYLFSYHGIHQLARKDFVLFVTFRGRKKKVRTI